MKLKVEDMEFEHDYMEVVQLVVNHHQLSNSGVDPYQDQGGHKY